MSEEIEVTTEEQEQPSQGTAEETAEEQPTVGTEAPTTGASEEEEPQTIPMKAYMEEKRKRQELELRERKREEEAAYQQRRQQDEEAQRIADRRPPTLEDVDFDEDKFRQAQIQYEVERQRAADQRAAEQYQQAQQRQNAQLQRQAAIDAVDATGKETFDDWDAVIVPAVQAGSLTEPMIDAFTTLDNGPQVAHALAKNPQEAQRIAQLPPMQQLVEVGKVSARLANPKPKTTGAPPPPKPVSARDSEASSDWMNDPNISTEEWVRRREKQLGG